MNDQKLTLNERLRDIILESNVKAKKLTKNDLRGVVFMVNASIHDAISEVEKTSINDY